MTLAAIKTTYRKKVQETEFYQVTFPKENKPHHYTLLLKHKVYGNSTLKSVAYIKGDTLILKGIVTKSVPLSVDRIFILDYWIAYAKFHKLSRIRSQPIMVGFTREKHETYGELPVDETINLLPICLEAFKALKIFQESDITFSYYFTHSNNNFISFSYSWEGTTGKLDFIYEDGQCFLLHLDKKHRVDEHTVSTLIPSLLKEVSDHSQLKNLIKPPTLHLQKLVRTTLGYVSTDICEDLATTIMEQLIALDYTYKEVEAEATRISNLGPLSPDVLSFIEKKKEGTLRFFNTHYIILLHKDFGLPFHVHFSQDKEEIIRIHQEHLRKSMLLQFEKIENYVTNQ